MIAPCQGWDIVSALGLYMTWICTSEDCVLNRLFPRCHPSPLTPAVYPPPLLHGGYTLREGVWWRHPIYYWVFLVCTHYIVADLSVWTQITCKRTFSWWWLRNIDLWYWRIAEGKFYCYVILAELYYLICLRFLVTWVVPGMGLNSNQILVGYTTLAPAYYADRSLL